jgi:ribosomal-protein-alanine N-acetyltransferase
VGEDIRARSENLGYWIGREFWGRGIATEVVGAFVEWVWETFPKIVSGRVLRKVRFEHLTTLKCGIWNGGKLAGLELWGLVRPGL